MEDVLFAKSALLRCVKLRSRSNLHAQRLGQPCRQPHAAQPRAPQLRLPATRRRSPAAPINIIASYLESVAQAGTERTLFAETECAPTPFRVVEWRYASPFHAPCGNIASKPVIVCRLNTGCAMPALR